MIGWPFLIPPSSFLLSLNYQQQQQQKQIPLFLLRSLQMLFVSSLVYLFAEVGTDGIYFSGFFVLLPLTSHISGSHFSKRKSDMYDWEIHIFWVWTFFRGSDESICMDGKEGD